MSDNIIKTMTPEEYLSQIKRMDVAINNKLVELEQLNTLLTRVNAGLSPDKVQTSGSGDRFGELMAKFIDTENEINKMIDGYVEKRKEIIIRRCATLRKCGTSE